MKRKIFSKLLMGALLCTSVSAFVSCKDYDDDINANKADVKAAQEQLTKLSGSLTSLQSALESQKTALQQELAQAKSQLETQIANAKAELHTAIAAKADQATVDALATRVSNLEKDLAATKEALNAKIDAINNSLASLQAVVDKKAEQAALDQAVATLNAAISGKVSTEDFNTFKGEVAKIETNLTNLTTLVGTKADQAKVDAAIAAINKDLAQLQKDLEAALAQQKKDFDAAVAQLGTQINSKADQSTVDALGAAVALKADQSALDALSGNVTLLGEAVAALGTAIDTKADKATVAQLEANTNSALQELKGQISNLVTPEQLNAAVDKLNSAINLLESNLNAKIDGKANQAEFAAVREDLANLRGAFERHNENIALAIGDAINQLDKKLQALIDQKVDKTDYAETVADLKEAQDSIASILTTLAAVDGDIDNIYNLIDDLDEETADSVGALRSSITNNAIAIRALQIQGSALAGFIGEFEEGATLAATLDALKEQMSQEVKDSIENQEKARAAAIAQIGEDIADLRAELQDTIDSNAASIKDLQEKFSKISDIIDQRIAENINNLTVFVSKSLKSISLVPQLFVGGIEAIEFNSLQYYAITPGTSGLTTRDAVASDLNVEKYSLNYKESRPLGYANKKYTKILTDNGLAEAYYRLNPSIVDRASIDEENIEFLAATAATRAATVASPVEFNGINTWNYGGKKGLVKVNLRKTADFRNKSLNDAGNGNIFIVALKVPRKATKISGVDVEAADIVSENSRLVERVMIPKIARLKWNTNETMNFYDPEAKAEGKVKVHHYTDSVTMYNQLIDKNNLVYDEVVYNESYDVLSRVTGCDVSVENKHTQITKADLKKYGLTFRFHIAQKVYNDVDHATDQQQFAAIDAVSGIVTSKIPNGVTDNRACVGKEPIITIQLVDTLNNQLVDERYMKIKWIEKTLVPQYLGEFKDETTLLPCKLNESTGIKWVDFINRVYAVIGEQGISQSTFEAVYPVANVTKSTVEMSWDGKAWNVKNNGKYLEPALNPGTPIVDPTSNKQGDALIAYWELQPAEIADIYPHQSKVFKSKITFKSILPTEYPDLTMDYIWTIKLPALPALEGYYDNYWFTKYSQHDVMPVQYNTAMYNNIASGAVVPGKGYGLAGTPSMELYDKANNRYFPGTDYCVFYNNLTNVFKYHLEGGKSKYVVNDIFDCRQWDLQFTMAGKDAANPDVTYTQASAGGQYKNASGASPALQEVNWKTAGAYKLLASNNKQALQLEWWPNWNDGKPDQSDDSYTAWETKVANNYAILYADHHNTANQALLNQLAAENESDGWTPKRTHDAKKAVHMGIWATLNPWNIVAIKDYDLFLVEPLRINTTLDGCFEEGFISGTAIKNADAFNMRDFRGYEVAKNAATGSKANIEQYKYQSQLYKYYEVGTPTWDLNQVKYGMELKNNSLVASETAKMSAADIKKHTNGNIILSIEQKTWNGEDYLVFKNNGGSNVEEEVWVYLPVSVDYGFGTVKSEIKVKLYPKGAGKGVAYPGNN